MASKPNNDRVRDKKVEDAMRLSFSQMISTSKDMQKTIRKALQKKIRMQMQ